MRIILKKTIKWTGEEKARAEAIHKKSIIVDGSNIAITNPWLPAEIIEELYFDDMLTGGVTASNVTAVYPSLGARFEYGIRQLISHNRLVKRCQEKAILALTVEDIVEAKKTNKAAIILGPQTGDIVGQEIENLTVLHELGMRILQITYNTRNYIGDGCIEKTDSGLSNFGREVISEMNRLGILIDLSHVGDKSTLESIELSKDPVAFTHANPRSIVPKIDGYNVTYKMSREEYARRRGRSDEQIKAMAEKGGVIGTCILGDLIKKEGQAMPTIDDYIDQIDYVSNLVGVDYIAFASDIDYNISTRRLEYYGKHPDIKDDHYPAEFGHGRLAYMPNVTKGLVSRGYSDKEIEKILGGNFLRVFRKVWGK